jgi:hypothetical protein
MKWDNKMRERKKLKQSDDEWRGGKKLYKDY